MRYIRCSCTIYVMFYRLFLDIHIVEMRCSIIIFKYHKYLCDVLWYILIYLNSILMWFFYLSLLHAFFLFIIFASAYVLCWLPPPLSNSSDTSQTTTLPWRWVELVKGVEVHVDGPAESGFIVCRCGRTVIVTVEMSLASRFAQGQLEAEQAIPYSAAKGRARNILQAIHPTAR